MQQTIIKVATPAYIRILKHLPTLEDFAHADDVTIRPLVQGLGYYRRFANFHRAVKEITLQRKQLNDPNWWPETYEEWLCLPGIGPYTAAAITSVISDHPVAVVDGNVERVISRIWDLRKPINAPGQKKLITEYAQEMLLEEAPGEFNQAMMELGQLICLPQNPLCGECPAQGDCLARKRASQNLAPGAKQKTAKISLNLCVTIVEDVNGLIGLIERPQDAIVLKSVKGFPTEVQSKDSHQQCSHSLLNLRKIGHFKHSITKYKITVTVYHQSKVDLNTLPLSNETAFVPKKDVLNQIISSLDRKAWNLFKSQSFESSIWAIKKSLPNNGSDSFFDSQNRRQTIS